MARRQKKHVRTRDARQRSVRANARETRLATPVASMPEGPAAERGGNTQRPEDERPTGPRVVLAPRDVEQDLDTRTSGRASLAEFDATFFSLEPDYGPGDVDSWPPTADDTGEAPAVVAPPYVLARRSVYRRVVGVVLAAAILVLVAGVGMQAASQATAQGSVAAAPPGAR